MDRTPAVPTTTKWAPTSGQPANGPSGQRPGRVYASVNVGRGPFRGEALREGRDGTAARTAAGQRLGARAEAQNSVSNGRGADRDRYRWLESSGPGWLAGWLAGGRAGLGWLQSQAPRHPRPTARPGTPAARDEGRGEAKRAAGAARDPYGHMTHGPLESY